MTPLMVRSPDPMLPHSPPTPRKKRRLLAEQPFAAPSPLGMLERLPDEIREEIVAPLVLMQGHAAAFSQTSRAARELMVDTASAALTRHVIRNKSQSVRSLRGSFSVPSADDHDALLRQAQLFLRRFDHPPYTLGEWAESQPAEQIGPARIAIARIKDTRARRVGLLYIDGLGLACLPDGFVNMAWLTSLNLSGNKLKSLPNDLSSIADLNILNLQFNEFTDIPAVVFSLWRLEIFNISDNQITEIPSGIRELRRLMMLDLSYNAITTLPSALCSLSQLEDLSLNDNQLASIPENIGQLNGLFEFTVANNRLMRLPESMGDMRLLQDLDISSNRIDALPATLQDCTSLMNLFLHQNRFEEVPAVVTNLTNLVQLSLFDNALRYRFPLEFFNLVRLREIYVDSTQAPFLSYLPLSRPAIDWVDRNPESDFHMIARASMNQGIRHG